MEILMDNTNSNSDEDQRNIDFDLNITANDNSTSSSRTSIDNEIRNSNIVNLKRKYSNSNTPSTNHRMTGELYSQGYQETVNQCVYLPSKDTDNTVEKNNFEISKRRCLSEKESCYSTCEEDNKKDEKIAENHTKTADMKGPDNDHVTKSISNSDFSNDCDIEAVLKQVKEVLNDLPIFLRTQARLELCQTLSRYKNLNEQMYSMNENLDMDTNYGNDVSFKLKNEMLVPD